MSRPEPVGRDRISVEQLTTFIACAEQGNFSAAARQLGRAQSVVSQSVAQLERQTGLMLFDRAGRLPVLTDAGRLLLAEARVVAGGLEGFRTRARDLVEGREPELAIAIDVLYPTDVLTRAAVAFREAWPDVQLRVQRDVLGGLVQSVVDGDCRIAIAGPEPDLPDSVVSEPMGRVLAVTVVSPRHPLAALADVVPREVAAEHLQLVVSDRSGLTQGRDFRVHASRTWRLGDMATKHAFLCAGLGWGHMPLTLVERDLAAGRLAAIRIEGADTGLPHYAMRALFRRVAPPGPVARWFLDTLRAHMRS